MQRLDVVAAVKRLSKALHRLVRLLNLDAANYYRLLRDRRPRHESVGLRRLVTAHWMAKDRLALGANSAVNSQTAGKASTHTFGANQSGSSGVRSLLW